MPYVRFLNGDLAEIPNHIVTDAQLYTFVRQIFPSESQNTTLRISYSDGTPIWWYNQPLQLGNDDFVFAQYIMLEPPSLLRTYSFKSTSSRKTKKSARKTKKSARKTKKSVRKTKKSAGKTKK